jgi:hypothetical protein
MSDLKPDPESGAKVPGKEHSGTEAPGQKSAEPERHESASTPPEPASPEMPVLSPWRDMWLKPRAVLRQQLALPPHWQQWLPAIFAGVAAVLETFALHPAELAPGVAAPSGQGLILMALLIGPLSGLLHVGLMGWLLGNMGRLFGGKLQAGSDAMRRAVSLALIPMAAALPLLLLELWLRQQSADNLVVMMGTVLRSGLNLWFLLLLVMAVSEVQQLSLRRAVGTVASVLLLLASLFLLLRGG